LQNEIRCLLIALDSFRYPYIYIICKLGLISVVFSLFWESSLSTSKVTK